MYIITCIGGNSVYHIYLLVIIRNKAYVKGLYVSSYLLRK